MEANGDGTATPSKYITLISRDGFEFVLLREAAVLSPAVKTMVNPAAQFSEARTARCTLQEMNGVVLGKVIDYLHYYHKYRDSQDVPDMEIPTELCLEILMAADFLGLDKGT